MSDEVKETNEEQPEQKVEAVPAEALISVEYAVAATYLLNQMQRSLKVPHHPFLLLGIDPVGQTMQVIVPKELGKLLLNGEFRQEILKMLGEEMESIAVRSTLEID